MNDEEAIRSGRRAFARLVQRVVGAFGLGLLLGRQAGAAQQPFGVPELERLRKQHKGVLKVWSEEPFVESLVNREQTLERESTQDYARAYNRFGRAYNRFGRAYNRFGRAYNRFGR